MRKSITLLTIFLTLGGTLGNSQSRFAEFNKFREKILSDYQNYRTRILDHYADFLNGEWHEFEAIMEEESPYSQQKPDQIPECDVAEMDTLVTNMMMQLPDAIASEFSLPGISHGSGIQHFSEDEGVEPIKIDVPGNFAAPSGPKTQVQGLGSMFFVAKEAEGKTNYELAAMKIPDPNFAFGPFPGQLEAPRPGESGVSNSDSKSEAKVDKQATPGEDFHFDFYGMDAFIPSIEFAIADNLSSRDQTGSNWENMAAQEGGIETARQLFGLAQQLGLNGYLTFRLAESYVNQRYKDSNDKARMAAVHFLMSNMGYDARLTEMGDIWTVMLPFDQKKVFGLLSKTYDDRRYTVLLPDGYELPKAAVSKGVMIATCPLPSDALGKTSDLRLTGLNLPMKPKEFEITRNGLTIKGTVNDNIRALLYKYPQMPMGDFATSWIDQQLRDDVVAQIKSQVEGMTETQAINTLMSLCHYGFDYETDQKHHGFEKPYFFEENFIYDYNDCEDRAIFFSYLVWNALGLPCQLIQYPNHESVAIAAVSDIDGVFYDTEGKKYYSSDPTFRGSRIGQIMTAFKETKPVVDQHYR